MSVLLGKKRDRQECLSYKNTAADYSVAVSLVLAELVSANLTLVPLESPCILFIERLSQVIEIGIESNEACCSLEEGLSASVVCQTIE